MLIIQANGSIKEQDVISRCLDYLPNSSAWSGSAYKVNFIIKPLSTGVPPKEGDTDKEKVCTAFFKIGYNEFGGRIWQFDKLDMPVN